MNNNTDVLIDIETTGLSAYAGIVSIGLSFFNWDTLELGKSYQVQLALCPENDLRELDDKVIDWWMSKRVHNDARVQLEKYTDKDGYSLKDGLILLDKLIQRHVKKSVHVWGNGSIFDMVILNNAYKQVGLKEPWYYLNVNDVRTALRIFKRCLIKNPTMNSMEDVSHIAKNDAIHERFVVVNGLTELDDICEKSFMYDEINK